MKINSPLRQKFGIKGSITIFFDIHVMASIASNCRRLRKLQVGCGVDGGQVQLFLCRVILELCFLVRRFEC